MIETTVGNKTSEENWSHPPQKSPFKIEDQNGPS